MPRTHPAIRIARALSRDLASMQFGPPVTHVYDPLVHAKEPAEQYLAKYSHEGVEAFLLGMNPGPFGMVQTGVPFGEVGYARNFLGIRGKVSSPECEHPKRPVLGFECTRSEVSGQRLWGWAERRFGTAERFFERFFVWNYCPLAFLEESGKNRTPDKLPVAEREPLFEACDGALRAMIELLDPHVLVGIGKFATDRLKAAVGDSERTIGTVLHPSPASPRANRGWAPQAEADLAKLGIDLD
ncbi:MAG: uracil-DNA glycosylase family protein [Planctomycetota bacterium]